jgi:hypothetical protein
MKYLPIALIFSSFVLFFISCDNDEAECEKNWYILQRNTSSKIEVDTTKNQLSIQVDDASGLIAEVYQTTVSGDFNFLADFSNYSTPNSSDSLSFAGLVLYDPTVPDTILDTSIVMAAIMNNRLMAVATVTDTVYNQTNAIDGQFSVRRTGNTIRIRAIAGLDTAQIIRNYRARPTRIGFRLGTLDSLSVSPGLLGIKIDKFEVISGGQGIQPIVSDDFICNSTGKTD